MAGSDGIPLPARPSCKKADKAQEFPFVQGDIWTVSANRKSQKDSAKQKNQKGGDNGR
jgi:hypothetical protein